MFHESRNRKLKLPLQISLSVFIDCRVWSTFEIMIRPLHCQPKINSKANLNESKRMESLSIKNVNHKMEQIYSKIRNGAIPFHSRRLNVEIVIRSSCRISSVLRMQRTNNKQTKHFKCIVIFAPFTRANKSKGIYITNRNENKQPTAVRTHQHKFVQAFHLQMDVRKRKTTQWIEDIRRNVFRNKCRKKATTEYHLVFNISPVQCNATKARRSSE